MKTDNHNKQRNHILEWLLRRPFIKTPTSLSTLFFILVITVVFITTHLRDFTISFDRSLDELNLTMRTHLNCTAHNHTGSCPISYPPSDFELGPSSTCPHYFNWIHEDLKPWAQSGITRQMVENARRTANFRLVILNGRAYVETYLKGFQSRDTFTLWGFLQLLRKYPGKIPDLDLMFDCVDWPVVFAEQNPNDNVASPPPLFRYCGDNVTLDIVFPDWSFWGWPEINTGPWDALLEELIEANKRIKWVDREPFAYWRGNPNVSYERQDLLKCNVSNNNDWNARLFIQDWDKEELIGFKHSNLAAQCKHRYKIYIEGSAWSVSEKNILACDSLTLLVKPRYYDFFTRSLMPLHHYWPINKDEKCKSIKFAVDWGNRHNAKAQEFGKVASRFVQEELKMEYVYDYMFHLLNEYAKLLKYKPSLPANAKELCMESMACNSQGSISKKFMMQSMVKRPSATAPCTMPPYNPDYLNQFSFNKMNSINKVESWENKYWEMESFVR